MTSTLPARRSSVTSTSIRRASAPETKLPNSRRIPILIAPRFPRAPSEFSLEVPSLDSADSASTTSPEEEHLTESWQDAIGRLSLVQVGSSSTSSPVFPGARHSSAGLNFSNWDAISTSDRSSLFSKRRNSSMTSASNSSRRSSRSYNTKNGICISPAISSRNSITSFNIPALELPFLPTLFPQEAESSGVFPPKYSVRRSSMDHPDEPESVTEEAEEEVDEDSDSASSCFSGEDADSDEDDYLVYRSTFKRPSMYDSRQSTYHTPLVDAPQSPRSR